MRIRKPLFFLFILVFIASSYVKVEKEHKETAAVRDVVPVNIFETSGFSSTPISEKAFRYAMQGYYSLLEQNKITSDSKLTIIDFTLPSNMERMAVYEVSNNQLLLTSLVAHGRNSGNIMATQFSNIPQSYQSSLGFYLTAETYIGKHGYSLRLDGLEHGVNDKARDRAVVIHGADYATSAFIEKHGRLGRSYGCPSLPPSESTAIIDQIKDDQVLFIYAEDEAYLSNSGLLNS
ncbi:MAG: murein L,D-transpeptidase catalytic domain family protein [Bacteroidetes bacterium]|nr:murein L,D-transpeptidase catalytic domain family protein [Bacteroidota bacterium]